MCMRVSESTCETESPKDKVSMGGRQSEKAHVIIQETGAGTGAGTGTGIQPLALAIRERCVSSEDKQGLGYGSKAVRAHTRQIRIGRQTHRITSRRLESEALFAKRDGKIGFHENSPQNRDKHSPKSNLTLSRADSPQSCGWLGVPKSRHCHAVKKQVGLGFGYARECRGSLRAHLTAQHSTE